GETMTTLDDIERRFGGDTALVCDADGPSGIGGIMGGQISEVSGETTRVLMEAATWVGPNIMRSSRLLGLRTEASARFEKQLHPETAMAGQRLAASLMVELCGARLVPGTLDAYPRPVEPRQVSLRPERMERLLGEHIEGDRVEEILERLGFGPRRDNGRVSVTVPSWRSSDVQREADLIEEVARIHGLDKLPTTLPARERAVGRLTQSQRLRRRLEDALRDRGLDECISYSFTSPEALRRLRLEGMPLPIENPLSEEMSVMRPLLLPGLLDAARHNAAHGRPGVALFESAHVYLGDELREAPSEGSPGGVTPATERHHLAALLTRGRPDGWRTEGLPADFFTARALLDPLGAATGVELRVEFGSRPFLHPGRSAVVASGGQELGWIGELHPLVLRDWELEGPVTAFELDADGLIELGGGRVPTYSEVTPFPAVLQDIAVVVPEEVSAAQLEAAVRAGGGELLGELRVFDLYHGAQVGEGGKSLAMRLEFRASDRTLTDDEVAARRAAIERELDRIGGQLRA
ncbi:MAG TPA: phenylalanine--tRNA ligase subunit beta, partial [Thermoleophilaceae bacterium]|nr:phenylalanine--tRNA ligase subunit beta [Thermoleophilaceae bacterium]